MKKGYVFDNAEEETQRRFAALPAMYDPGTIRHLEQLAVSEGWNCLEIGAGAGTIAKWLGMRVGSTGRVLATDLDTRFLDQLDLPNVEVRRHNIESDPLPEDAFDLIHLRLVLVHLLGRDRVVQSLVGSLRSGGWLLAEEFDSMSMPADPDANPAETLLATDVVFREVMTARGLDLRYGRKLPSRFEQIGLVDVDAEGRVPLWRGADYGGMLMRANFEQLRDEILATGRISERQFELDLARLNDKDFVRPSSVMWAVWGRRP